MKKAILFGASGFVGSYLLEELLNAPEYEKVTIVVRKSLNRVHPRLETLIGEYASLPDLKGKVAADDIFIALGTTRKKTPDKRDYYRADHDYPVLAAKIAKEQGTKSVLVVTAIGANAASGIFYVRTKGETERDILALDFEHTHIFRPSMLMGTRKEKRSLEKIFIGIWGVINPLFAGGWSRYRGIDGKAVAGAMLHAAGDRSAKVKIYYWKEMMEAIGK